MKKKAVLGIYKSTDYPLSTKFEWSLTNLFSKIVVVVLNDVRGAFNNSKCHMAEKSCYRYANSPNTSLITSSLNPTIKNNKHSTYLLHLQLIRRRCFKEEQVKEFWSHCSTWQEELLKELFCPQTPRNQQEKAAAHNNARRPWPVRWINNSSDKSWVKLK